MFQKSASFSAVLIALSAFGCGGRSSLDDYSNGISSVLPQATNTPGGLDDGGLKTGGSSSSGSGSDAGPKADAGGVGGTGVIGSSCSTAGDCKSSGSTCLMQVPIGGMFTVSFPGGYCSVSGCQSDADCSPGSGCANAGGTRACLATCKSNDDCRTKEGYRCGSLSFMQGGTTYCIPPLGGGGTQAGNTGGFPGGTSGGSNGGTNSNAQQICMFLCQNPTDIAKCVATGGDFQNLPAGCQGGGFTGGGSGGRNNGRNNG